MKDDTKLEKKYSLEIFLEDGISHREQIIGGCTVNDLRLVISMLDELKLRLISTVMSYEKEYDIKTKMKQ